MTFVFYNLKIHYMCQCEYRCWRNKMKQLSDERLQILIEKLAKYIGPNVKVLIDREDGKYCFREQRNRVYYVANSIMKIADTFNKDNLVSLGTCLGKFTQSNKFRLHITALVHLAPYAERKLWLKSNAEQQFLYGNNITKSGLGRISENAQHGDGVVIFNMADVPLGFGIVAKSTADCKHADPMAIICFHQADVGEYIRSEEDLL